MFQWAGRGGFEHLKSFCLSGAQRIDLRLVRVVEDRNLLCAPLPARQVDTNGVPDLCRNTNASTKRLWLPVPSKSLCNDNTTILGLLQGQHRDTLRNNYSCDNASQGQSKYGHSF